ncbi:MULTISPECIES: dihydrodipicolinate synthase family protein [Actinoalloteichus]|uniref:Dihydrodipicolinate synthase/N-acetylneuraminate lyase n=1 Tax=Actinoalloteichus fjordicus TaxID=1612552 RepID=A0AAC9PTC8_9PSEU|nr:MULTISPECIES: dihydrodipicolinate synthase family protein [Actinoalloteichus]APU15935.1 dihydrodipicolinate synthase/N-acetylneuraminate lyase [Actinoalloteichus fjordicus]APU21997.1 dihydrodipicolinate synthase/N-acetylneuraminate lyase [Actinoalloteichus sp. GBA129-24]
MQHTVAGLVPILATPFHADGSLDLAGLARLTRFQLDSGVDGVATFGMASEGFALTAEEREQIMTTIVDVVAGAVPVVAGVNGTSTVTALEQARAAEALGAQALMVLPPFMVKPSPAQLVDFYGDLASAVSTEIMVQDAPGVTGVAMAPALVAQLSALDRVTSVKVEAPPTAPKTKAIADLVPAEFAVLGGQNAQFVIEEYARGAVGTMPACEFPDLLRPVLADFTAGRRAEARAAFARLTPLILFGLQPGIAWAVHKEVLVRRGIIEHTTVRSPAAVLDEASRESLHAILDELALPSVAVGAR